MTAEERAALFQAKALLVVADKALSLASSPPHLDRDVRDKLVDMAGEAWQLQNAMADLLADDAKVKRTHP